MAAESQGNPTTEKILNFLVPIIYGHRVLIGILLVLLTVFFGYQTAQVRPDAGFDTLPSSPSTRTSGKASSSRLRASVLSWLGVRMRSSLPGIRAG